MHTARYWVMLHKNYGLHEMVTLGPFSLLSLLVKKQNFANSQIQINAYD
jgi:hypothetical protein